MDRLKEILDSKEYVDAKTRIRNWKRDISKVDKSEIKIVEQEIAEFFNTMRTNDPELYNVFKINHKELRELIHEKITGQKIIID